MVRQSRDLLAQISNPFITLSIALFQTGVIHETTRDHKELVWFAGV